MGITREDLLSLFLDNSERNTKFVAPEVDPSAEPTSLLNKQLMSLFLDNSERDTVSFKNPKTADKSITTQGGIRAFLGDTNYSTEAEPVQSAEPEQIKKTDGNARRVITNIPEVRDNAQGPVTWIGGEDPVTLQPKLKSSLITAEERVPDFLSTIAIGYKQLSELTDPFAVTEGLAKLQSTVAVEQARIKGETQADIYKEYQIPALEASLSTNIRLDRSSPNFVARNGFTDSSETEGVRQKLAAMKAAADGAIPERLAKNREFTELGTYATIMGNYTAHHATGLKDKEANLTLNADLQLRDYDQEQRGRLGYVLGVDSTDPLAVANALKRQKPQEKQELDDAVKATKEQIPGLAIVGNKYAKDLLVQTESEATGEAVNFVKPRVEEVLNIARDPAFAQKKFEELVTLKATDVSKIDQNRKDLAEALATLKAAGKETSPHKEAAHNFLAAFAQTYAQTKASINLNSDLATPNKSDKQFPPYLVPLAHTVKQSGGTIPLTVAMAEMNAAPTIEERKIRRNQLVEFYEGAVRLQNRSSLFKVDNDSAKQIQAQAAMPSIFERYHQAQKDALNDYVERRFKDKELYKRGLKSIGEFIVGTN